MDTAKYKILLEAEAKQLTADMTELGIQNPLVAADWVERADDLDIDNADLNEVADRTEEYDERRATLATLEGRLNDIKLALQKIADGTYGICEVSGEPIETDRLDANPAARTCKAHLDDIQEGSPE